MTSRLADLGVIVLALCGLFSAATFAVVAGFVLMYALGAGEVVAAVLSMLVLVAAGLAVVLALPLLRRRR